MASMGSEENDVAASSGAGRDCAVDGPSKETRAGVSSVVMTWRRPFSRFPERNTTERSWVRFCFSVVGLAMRQVQVTRKLGFAIVKSNDSARFLAFEGEGWSDDVVC